MVWLTSSLVTLEVLKIITGRWKPVVAPEHWHITPGEIRIEKFKPPSGAMKLLESYLKNLFEDKETSWG